ncbi:MAG: membrane protein insertion efficiency factor YidD [Polyangiaceae bacterium]|nr:membrane protein insertion efficiency factor YidD [Polyangiaceae bacterium]
MMARILIAMIRVYQLTLSKLLVLLFGPVCRFEPSCSRYAMLCIEGHGVLRGSLLSAKRLCRCHPFHPGGYDPPPPADDRRARRPAGRGQTEDSSRLLDPAEPEHALGQAACGAIPARGAISPVPHVEGPASPRRDA